MIYQSLRAKKNGRQSKCSLVPILSFLRSFSFLPEKSLFVFHHERFSICRIYVTTDEIAQLLADFSSASVGDTYNILKNLARAMSIYMSNGRSVKLEGVGTFYYTSTAAGQGVDTPEEVNASQITGVRVRFLPEYTRSADHTATRALVPDSLKWEEWGGAASTPSGTPGGGSTSGSGDDGGDDGEL